MLGTPRAQTPDEWHARSAAHPVANPAPPLDREVRIPVAADHDMDRIIENDLVPRLALAHRERTSPAPVSTRAARSVRDSELAAFIEVVIGTEDGAAPAFVRALMADGVTVESVFVDLLGPTARDLGIRWEDDECSFVDVTVALGRLQRVLRDLSQHFQAESNTQPDSAGHVLLTCLPGEQHTLGLILVAEFLIRDGFRVLVGAPWSESDLLTQVQTEWFDVIGFSAGCESRLSTLKREVARIRAVSRNPNVRILVGGQVFSLETELVARVGADGWARNAQEAPRVIRDMLATGSVASSPLDASGSRSLSADAGTPRETVRSQ